MVKLTDNQLIVLSKAAARGCAGDSRCELTDTKLIVLSKAARREDKAAGVPDRMNKGAAAEVGASLVVRKLMREIHAKPGMPVWRMDDDGRRISLIITRAGREMKIVTDPMARSCRAKIPP